MITGREDVRQHGEVGLVLGALGQLQAVEVGERHPQILGLPTSVGAHRDVAVGAAREARVDGQAETGHARQAVLAEAAGHVEGHHHPVTLADRDHARPSFHDDPHVLVPEHRPGLDVGPAFIHVQVRPADRGRRDLHQGVGGLLDPRIGDVLDGYGADPRTQLLSSSPPAC